MFVKLFLLFLTVAWFGSATGADGECGQLFRRQKRSIDGNVFTQCTWPWLVFVRMVLPARLNLPPQPLGTGVLIGNKAVVINGVTAYGFNLTRAYFNDADVKLQVTVGEYDTRYKESWEETIDVVDFAIAGNFAFQAMPTHDVAILQLAKNVTRSPCVQPACLATNSTEYPNDQACRLVGWGQIRSNFRDRYPIPLSKDVHILDHNSCTYSFPQTVLPEGNICAIKLPSSANPVKACNTDIGSMLMCETTTTGHWVLRGILSKSNCDQDVPMIMTDIEAHADWLQREKNAF